MKDTLNLKIAFEKSRLKSLNKVRNCMIPDCSNTAIKSHVFQKKGIISEIAKDNHVYFVEPPGAFDLENKGPFMLSKKGINEVFTFPGYCKDHDGEVFKGVEIQEPDYFNIHNQYLLGYRSLCQEIRRKEIIVDEIADLDKTLFPLEIVRNIHALIEGNKIGLKNLYYYKAKLEKGIILNDYSEYQFETIKIPRIEVCLSAPFTLTPEPVKPMPVYEFQKFFEAPFETNIVNVFPRKENSYIIVGSDKQFSNRWAFDLIHKIKHGDSKSVIKVISDLISARCEFWCISEKAYKRISKQTMEKFIAFFLGNVFDHSYDLPVPFNLLSTE